jgi:hypothetical protein
VIRILIQTPDGDRIAEGKFKTIEAIHQLQRAIDELRQRAAPVFDASWGEQPQPLLAPTEAELHQFINR